jgi:hypothetical protein
MSLIPNKSHGKNIAQGGNDKLRIFAYEEPKALVEIGEIRITHG